MYKEITKNKRKTVLLMIIFVLLVGLLGWLFAEFWGSPSITPFVLATAGIYAVGSYWVGSRAALALDRAQPIQKQDNIRLWRIVENLSIATGLPMPQVYIINDPALNAFATGRDPKHSAVAVTSGLLDKMTDTELEGVIAHELGHIQNYDIRVSMMAFALVAVVSILADIMLRMVWFRDNDNNNSNSSIFLILGIAAAILAPFAAMLIQLSISRKREYLADATGSLTTRYPEGLASALEKIGANGSTLKRQNSSTAHFFIANPLKKKSLTGLFSTHPPIEERVARLRKMGLHA